MVLGTLLFYTTYSYLFTGGYRSEYGLIVRLRTRITIT